MASQLMVGAHAVAHINGQKYGNVIGFDYSIDSPRRFIQTVDTLIPFEAVPGPSSIMGTLSMYRLRGTGGAEGLGIVAPQVMEDGTSGIAMEKYWKLLILDRVSGSTIFQSDYCSTISQKWSIQRGYIVGNIQFRALSYNNEIK